MTNDPEKSDPCTVAVKSANKPELGAESMERKRGTEGGGHFAAFEQPAFFVSELRSTGARL